VASAGNSSGARPASLGSESFFWWLLGEHGETEWRRATLFQLAKGADAGSIPRMPTSPAVSVVIPVYKASEWLEATLESLLRQTYPVRDLEILVVDDASPDDSSDIARRFLERHSLKGRVIVREQNGGVGAARNTGWNAASGDWIQFLDADDLLAPHKIELQVLRASRAEDSVAVVYSNWQYLVLQGGSWQPTGELNAPFVDDNPVEQILQEQTFGYVGPTLIRKSILPRMGGFPTRPNPGEDTDFMLRIAMAGGHFREARSTEAAFLYRQIPGSMWRTYSKNVEAMRNLLRTFRSGEEFLRQQSPDGSVSEAARLALARRYSSWADFYCENDPETYRMLVGWLERLGFARPICQSRSLRVLSTLLGYENAVRVRSAYRSRIRRAR
jgi:glycosyltransferase involved in cell wall biosynthesis